MMPCNSIVISDSYMFNTANIDIKCCVKNIEGLLDAVLPQDFADTFHILLFTDEILGNNDNIYKAIGDIKAYIKSKRSYDIILESVFINLFIKGKLSVTITLFCLIKELWLLRRMAEKSKLQELIVFNAQRFTKMLKILQVKAISIL